MTGNCVPGPLGTGKFQPDTDAGTLARTRSERPDDRLQSETTTGRALRGRPRNVSRALSGQVSPGHLPWVTVPISFVVIEPVLIDYQAQLAHANSLFARFNISFHVVDHLILPEQLGRARTVNLPLDWQNDNIEASVNLNASLPDVRNLSGRMKVLVVSPRAWAAADALARHLDDRSMDEWIYLNYVTRADSLAHDFVHKLLNDRRATVRSGHAHAQQAQGISLVGDRLTEEQVLSLRARAARSSVSKTSA